MQANHGNNNNAHKNPYFQNNKPIDTNMLQKTIQEKGEGEHVLFKNIHNRCYQ